MRPLLCSSIVAVLLMAGCARAPESYVDRIAAERAAKDAMFLEDEDSPILPGDRERFLPLSYFPIDESYAVPAQLTVARERTRLVMPTSTGRFREMERIGTLDFTLKGEQHSLTAFYDPTSPVERLFVPFGDLTNGTETYQAGRYMELEPTATRIYVVDFNVAYAPYCYYNPQYDCPIPPPENRLSVPIRAGERLRDEEVTLTR